MLTPVGDVDLRRLVGRVGGEAVTRHLFKSNGGLRLRLQSALRATRLTRGKVRAAYQRSPQLEKRRAILQEWSDFVTMR